MKIAIIYSIPSSRMLKSQYGETDADSEEIANMVARGLAARGMSVQLYPIGENEIEKISQVSGEVVFNLIEWCGLDIDLSRKAFEQLRSLNKPITGSRWEQFELTGDKIRLKQKLIELGIRTPSAGVFPAIVKPSLEHCSMGLTDESIAYDQTELERIVKRQEQAFGQPAVVEEFIKGRELLVYLLEEKTGVRVLPIEEVVFNSDKDLPFQTYQTKWVEGHPDYDTTEVEVAKLSSDEQLAVEQISRETFNKLGLWGYARFDLRLRDGKPYILEANANPSVYDAESEITDIETEVIPGIEFPDYLLEIVRSAQRHFEAGERV